ncbi:MAG: tRNA (adenosine(37)-N6)-dimethylallyltransferase MiaA [Chlorobi bacterium]|nr:tRNA (adenosine(37)-N6)-dimethylallyltransferase MiaA [Chlorobiota bacterium]
MKGNADINLIVITGPTATGKTRLGALLAHRLEGEVISGDSRQVYRGMDIGTGKDLEDFIVDGKKIPYHLIDIHDPGYEYNVYEYQKDFFRIFTKIHERGNLPVLVGGTGLYIEAVLRGYKLIRVPVDPAYRTTLDGKSMEELTAMLTTYKKLHNITDLDTRKRLVRALEIEHYYATRPETDDPLPEINPMVFGINVNRETRRENISRRLRKRLDEGMVEEVRKLLDQGVTADHLIYYGLEYKYITLYLTGKLSYDDMVKKLEISIHQFAKRQVTWFRGMEKRGIPIHWIDAKLPDGKKIEKIIELLSRKSIQNKQYPYKDGKISRFFINT